MSQALPYLEYTSTSEPSVCTTENFVGMHVNSATQKLNSSGVKYKIVGNGNVILSQIPSAGIEITKDLSTVYLYTVNESISNVTIPNLCGLTAYEANLIATNAGLNIKIIGVDDPALRKKLIVTEQSISEGEKVKTGTVIVIRVLKTDFED